MPHASDLSRRGFLRQAQGGIIKGGIIAAAASPLLSCSRDEQTGAPSTSDGPTADDDGFRDAGPLAPIALPKLSADTEQERQGPPERERVSERVGYAMVGLGTLALTQILPALDNCKRSRLVALVSGSPDKALIVAQQYGIRRKAIYDYRNFDLIRNNPEIQAVYIALPNGMHAEYTIRGARAGKHILCEKPMANTSLECQQMIQACAQERRHLMVAYRLQYEPHHRDLIDLVRAKELGTLRAIAATNGQNLGDPKQWRLAKALAGGGSLMDVGIYCINAARYVTGEEPVEVAGRIMSDASDVRFREVEDAVSFQIRFPSGVIASCSCGYGNHEYRRLAVMGSSGWAEMDNAFTYSGLRLRSAMAKGKLELVTERMVEPANHFSAEIDHFSSCIRDGKPPYTGGEEGHQDLRLIESIYLSASDGGRPVPVTSPRGTHGPALAMSGT